MRIGIVTIFPELIASVLRVGVVGRAIEDGDLEVLYFNPRDHAKDVHRSVDDRPFGGGPGMLLKAGPLADALNAAKNEMSSALSIAFTPQGKRLNQDRVFKLSQETNLILVAGRYEGIDDRFFELCVDQEISIGDYILTGGEVPALVLIDAVTRVIDGTLGNQDSVNQDSFNDNLLEGPQYTRPREWSGESVPDVLLSGDHAKIERWNREQALKRTWERRPDLLLNHQFTETDRDWLKRYSKELKTRKET